MSEVSDQWTASKLVEKMILEETFRMMEADKEEKCPHAIDSPAGVDRANEWLEEECYEDYYQDAKDGVRCGKVETGLPVDGSRHYESKAVAAQVGGYWVGWTYWFGGGKHGEPGSIEWIDDAYLLEVTEETRVIQVFKKAE